MPKCYITERTDTRAPCTNTATTMTDFGKPVCAECAPIVGALEAGAAALLTRDRAAAAIQLDRIRRMTAALLVRDN